VLSAAGVGCSNSIALSPWQANFDAFDIFLRAQCNSQKMTHPRIAIIGTELASEFGLDDRTRSKLIADQRNGSQGLRVWRNIGGFNWIREYPDVINAGNNLAGIMMDPRFALVAVRKIEDMANAAESLGVPSVMNFYPLRDTDTGLEICGITWQDAGTGDQYITAAILFGVAVGNQGGAPGSMTDDAGCLITLS